MVTAASSCSNNNKSIQSSRPSGYHSSSPEDWEEAARWDGREAVSMLEDRRRKWMSCIMHRQRHLSACNAKEIKRKEENGCNSRTLSRRRWWHQYYCFNYSWLFSSSFSSITFGDRCSPITQFSSVLQHLHLAASSRVLYTASSSAVLNDVDLTFYSDLLTSFLPRNAMLAQHM